MELHSKDRLICETQSKFISLMKNKGFKINPLSKNLQNLEELIKNHEEIEKEEIRVGLRY